MIWNVYYADDAEQDLQAIYEHISNILLTPAIALKQVNSIMDAVDSLDDMPFRFPLYDKEPWRTKGLRFMPVDNYLVFYLPVESQNSVAVIRIMYKGRDVEAQLDESVEEIQV